MNLPRRSCLCMYVNRRDCTIERTIGGTLMDSCKLQRAFLQHTKGVGSWINFYFGNIPEIDVFSTNNVQISPFTERNVFYVIYWKLHMINANCGNNAHCSELVKQKHVIFVICINFYRFLTLEFRCIHDSKLCSSIGAYITVWIIRNQVKWSGISCDKGFVIRSLNP